MQTAALDLLPYLAFTALGFIIKFLLDRYAKHKDFVRFQSWRIKVESLENKLSQFYWPVYCRLKRGSIAWNSENFRDKTNSPERKALASQFDELIITKNHEETRDIIQGNFHHFGGNKELESALIELLHHIDIYLSLRAAGLPHDPIWVGQSWPRDVERLLEENLHKLQAQYDHLLKEAGSPLL